MDKDEIKKWFIAGLIFRSALATGAYEVADKVQREYLEATR